MQADGSVILDTSISTAGLEKGFQQIKDDVGGIADAAQKAGDQIRAAFSEVDVSKPVANARAKVEQLSARLAQVTEELKVAKMDDDDKGAARLEVQRTRLYDQLAEARRRLAVEIAAATEKEAKAEEKAADRAAKAAEKEAAAKERAQTRQFNQLTKPMHRFGTRMREIITGALFFNLISRGLHELTQYFGAALKSNDAFSASFARLKGALLTAFQPIYEVALPALIALMNVLTAVINAVGRFFAAISGKSYKQMQQNASALHDQAAGIGAVGSAAKKAKKELAGFDDINRLSFADMSGGGGGGGVGAGGIDADFADAETIANLDHILYLVGAIGAALLTWKIASAFTDSLSLASGLALTVGGAFLYGFNWADAFANGIDWANLSGMLLGLVSVVGGLALAFGSTGAAVGLLVGGVGLVVVAIKNWIKTGELGTESCFALVVGITAIGAAISLFTGSWIPLALTAVAGFVIAAVTNGDKIKDALARVMDWVKGFFLRDWREVFGNTLGSIFNTGAEIVVGIIDGLLQAFGGLIDFVKGVFTGDWRLAWQGLSNIVKGIFNGMIGAVNGLVSGICKGLNAIIRAINKINFTIPEWVPSYGGKKIGFNLKEVSAPQIPYLAKGAVIPPNAPFLAMLGDQKSGTNIEAPLSTIEDAVERVMRRNSGISDERIISLLSQLLEAVLNIEIDGEMLSKAIDNYRRKEAVSRG